VKEWQLFDLQKDPAELNNLVNNRSYLKIMADMKKELMRLRDVYDDHAEAGEFH
jgi:hypothetical protein